MTKHNSMRKRRKSNAFLITLVSITIIAAIVTGILITRLVYANNKLKDSTEHIETIVEDNKKLEEEVKELEGLLNKQEEEKEKLEEEIKRFQPIIIPNSMKKN